MEIKKCQFVQPVEKRYSTGLYRGMFNEDVTFQFEVWRSPDAVANKAVSIFDPNPTNQKVGSSSLSGHAIKFHLTD